MSKDAQNARERDPSPVAKKFKFETGEMFEIFVSNIPYEVTEAGLHVAFERIFEKIPGGVKSARFSLKKGLAWLGLQSEQAVTAALVVEAELGRRKLRIQRSRCAIGPSEPETVKKTSEPNLPFAECWFCLGSSQCDPDYITSCTLQSYTTLARGGIADSHLVLSSVEHVDCFAKTTDLLQTDLQTQLQRLDERLGPSIWFERWTPFKFEEANHLQINFIPYEKKDRKVQSLNLESLGDKYTCKQVESLVEISTATAQGDTPHFWLRYLDDQDKEIFLVITAKAKGGNLPKDLGRELVCKLLDSEDRVDWRVCVVDKTTAIEKVLTLRTVLND